MIIQISRFSSSALLPSSGCGVVVVVVAWAPSVPSPGTSRLLTVVNVMPWASEASAAASSWTGSSSSTTGSASPSLSGGGGDSSVTGGAVSCVVGGAVVGGLVGGGGGGGGSGVVVVVVVVGSGCWANAPDAAPTSTPRTTSAAMAARHDAARPPRDGLPAVMYSHLAGPQPRRSYLCPSFGRRTLHLSK
jgi:hypothetical protein